LVAATGFLGSAATGFFAGTATGVFVGAGIGAMERLAGATTGATGVEMTGATGILAEETAEAGSSVQYRVLKSGKTHSIFIIAIAVD
jgi:hypothetical protein